MPRPRRNRDDVRPRGHVALAAGIVAGSPDAAVGRESQDRDRGCAYPGCTATRFVEIHHLQHGEDGGGTDYDNLICLCPHHHDAHHAGVFTIAASHNAVIPFTFAARRGWAIHATPPEADDPGRGRPTGAGSYTPPLGERADYGWITYRRNDTA